MATKQPRRSGWTAQHWRLLGVACLLVALAGAALWAGARRQFRVSVYADGQTTTVAAGRSMTAAEGLAAAAVVLNPLDRVSVPLTATLSPSSFITVTRVQVRETTRSAPIAAPRQTIADSKRVRGYRELVQEGAAGLKEIVEAATLEDGRIVQTQIVRERTLREPVAEQVIEGTRADPALDAFRESALGYLGRGGITRLAPAVVEQTVYELSRLRGDRYGSVRVLTQAAGRPWLVLTTFARTPQDAVLFVFWWTDELHAFAQVLGEGIYLLDARAMAASDAIELGLVVATEQAGETLAPQFILRRLPQTPAPADTWRVVWSSHNAVDWRSNQGTVTFLGSGLDQLAVRGAATATNTSAAARIVECASCPRRRFDAIWQRRGDLYQPLAQGVVASPYATLWDFMSSLTSNMTATLPLVSDHAVITAAVQSGLSRVDVQWTVRGNEQDTAFDMRGGGLAVRVTLAARGTAWVISGVGPIPQQGKILYTGTRPVVRGMYVTDTTASAPPLLLGDGQRYVWSPDYRRVAYEWQGAVYVAGSDGSNQRGLGRGSAPAWSWDGTWVVYVRPRGNDSVIVIANVDDGGETVLVGGSQPAWAPTAPGGERRIAFASRTADGGTAIYVIDVATGATMLLASDGSGPLWSPDGDAVSFLTSRGEIAVVTLSPAGVTTVGPGAGYTWSSDGSALIFLSALPAGRPLRWERQSGQTSAILDRSDIDGLALSPDGTEIVFSVAGNNGLWLARRDGSDLRKLGDGRDPVWGWLPRAGR